MNEQKALPASESKWLWLAVFALIIIGLYLAANGNGKQFAARGDEESSNTLATLDQADRASGDDFSDCVQPG